MPMKGVMRKETRTLINCASAFGSPYVDDSVDFDQLTQGIFDRAVAAKKGANYADELRKSNEHDQVEEQTHCH